MTKAVCVGAHAGGTGNCFVIFKLSITYCLLFGGSQTVKICMFLLGMELLEAMHYGIVTQL